MTKSHLRVHFIKYVGLGVKGFDTEFHPPKFEFKFLLMDEPRLDGEWEESFLVRSRALLMGAFLVLDFWAGMMGWERKF
jgi:hypothetical protein